MWHGHISHPANDCGQAQGIGTLGPATHASILMPNHLHPKPAGVPGWHALQVCMVWRGTPRARRL